jgi:hypothetical protein
MLFDLNKLDREKLIHHRMDLFSEIFVRGRESQRADIARKQAAKDRKPRLRRQVA